MNSRRLLIIIGLVILLAVIGVGLYFVFLSPKTSPATTPSGASAGSLPNAGNQQVNNSQQTNSPAGAIAPTSSAIGKNFGIISDEAVLDYYVNAGNIATAVEPDGKIVQVIDGKVTNLNALQIQNIHTAKFSHDGAKILVNFGDAASPQTSIFDIATKAWTPMPAGWQSPVWASTDNRIAYGINNANGTESFATFDVSKPKNAAVTLISLHVQDMVVSWINANQLAFSTKPDSSFNGSVLLYNAKSGTTNLIDPDMPGVEIIWSKLISASSSVAGMKFYSTSNGKGESVQLINAQGGFLQPIKFSTLSSKCLFSSETSTPSTLYCAVPRDQQSLASQNLPQSYYQMAFFTSDDLYRINTQSGATDAIFNDPTQNIDITNVKFFNNRLFFVNRYNQKLYTISL